MKNWPLLLIAVAIVFTISACSSEEEKPSEAKGEVQKEEINKENPKKEEVKSIGEYRADNVYNWLKESGLVSSEAKDVTAKFEGSEGLVKALRTDEADIIEFQKNEQAAEYHNPAMDSYAVKNVFLLIKKGQDNANNFVKVLESGHPLKDLQTSYASEQQKKVAELMEDSSDFLPIVEAYFALPKGQNSTTWDTFMVNKTVTWSGTIADLEAIGDSIVVYGGQKYNDEDWNTISTEKKDMMPYTFIVELKDKSMKKDLKKGDKATFKASLASRGDKALQYNWKLYEGEIVN
ncbi:hypothetical protein [Paenibacillus lactis]|uniref:hypothetical protein n=1 Tax=Paenibacillus lactis TaxID=228574 RepID=UPI0036A3186B